MHLKYIPYSLKLKEPFGTAHGIRTSTEGMLVALEQAGIVGYGEVFMPPYYPENQTTMTRFFDLIDEREMLAIKSLAGRLEYVSSITAENRGAKAALDIALHDLSGKAEGRPVRDLVAPADEIDLTARHSIPTSFTIGFDSIDTMVRKALEADSFETLKIKLNGTDDIEIISSIRAVTNQELYVDVNQGWTDIDQAMRVSEKLVELGVGLIEQPFPTGQELKAGTLRMECAVPIVADEDVQTITDIVRLAEFYDGINVKLMKAGGIREGRRMIAAARDSGLKVLLGCMTESSIGISAAAQIAHLADWCDLDGNLLIKNDTCRAIQTVEGRLNTTDTHGIGITDDSSLREWFQIED